MMKRILSLLLTLTLLLSTAYAAVEVTLPEKMLKQMEVGGGVKGTLSVSASGSAPWLDLLLPLTGAELQIRHIQQPETNAFQTHLYVLDELDNERADTYLYGDGQQLFFSSELLDDTLLTLSLQGESGNASFYSVVRSMMNVPASLWEDEKDPEGWPAAIAPYEHSLDAWMDEHASQPTVLRGEDGSASLITRYELPAQSVKEQMKVLVNMLLKDPLMLEKLGDMMSEEQRALYLNPSLAYYYEHVIDALTLERPVLITRELNAMGVILNSSMTLPLPANEGGWTELVLGQSDDDTSYVLKGEKQTLSLVMNRRVANAENTIWKGTLRSLPAEGEKLSLAFELRRYHTLTEDDDRRSHDKTLWEFTAQTEQPESGYMSLDPISVTLNTYFHSKHLNQNPTTLELTLNAVLPGVQLDLSAELKTSSGWAMEKLPTENARPIDALTPEEAASLTSAYIRNAVQTMTTLTIAEMLTPGVESSSDEPRLEPAAPQLPPATMTDLPEDAEPMVSPDVVE